MRKTQPTLYTSFVDACLRGTTKEEAGFWTAFAIGRHNRAHAEQQGATKPEAPASGVAGALSGFMGEAPMAAPWLLLVDTSKEGLRAWRYELLWAAPLIAGFLLLMALVVAWVKQWRQRPHVEQCTSSDQLAYYRTLYERGELSEEEYVRVRTRLAARLRKEIDKPTVLPPAPAPPSPGATAAPSGNGAGHGPSPQPPPLGGLPP